MTTTERSHHVTIKQWKALIVFGLGQNFFVFYSRSLLEYVVEGCAKDLVDHKYLTIYIGHLLFIVILSVRLITNFIKSQLTVKSSK